MAGANGDIRAEAKSAGVTLWAVAEEIGVSEATFTRRLRLELDEAEKGRIRAAIAHISQRNAEREEGGVINER